MGMALELDGFNVADEDSDGDSAAPLGWKQCMQWLAAVVEVSEILRGPVELQGSATSFIIIGAPKIEPI